MRKLCYTKLKMREQMAELDTRHRSSVYDSMVKYQTVPCFCATGMTDKDFETPIVGVDLT